MPTDNVDTLVAETRQLITEVEAGNTDHAAWVAIQDRVKQLYDGRTQTEVGKLLDKSKKWVSQLLAWSVHEHTTPFARTAGSPSRRASVQQAETKRVIRETPEFVAEAIKSAPPEAQRKAIEAIASDEDLHDDVVSAAVEAMGGTKSRKPKARPAKTWMALWKAIDDALRRMKHGLEELKDQPEWDEDTRNSLLVRLYRAKEMADFMIGYIEGGDDVVSDIEDYLATIAEDERSSTDG